MTKEELKTALIGRQNMLLKKQREYEYLDSICGSRGADIKNLKRWSKKLRKENLKLRAALKAIL